ncbi:MAG: 50S ribosomal protein L21 [bacterium]|nr:50S ribosomal protein L21 [bacterium]
MKKAVIKSGGIQFVVEIGDVIVVDLLKDAKKTVDFTPLLVIDGDKVDVGTPEVKGAKVTADVVEADTKADKVTAIRFKAKKRVKKIRGHRQRQTHLKIKSIS